MHLVIVVLYREEHLDDVLSAFAELGLENAVVLEGTRMQEVLAFDVPIFAGLAAGALGGKTYVKVVMTTTDENGMCRRIGNLVKDLDIDFDEPGTGLLLSLPNGELITSGE